MNETKLFACPFCGGEAEEIVTAKNTVTPKYKIRCKNCGVSTKTTVTWPEHINDWNVRTASKYELFRLSGLEPCCETCRCFKTAQFGSYCDLLHVRRDDTDFCSKWKPGKEA